MSDGDDYGAMKEALTRRAAVSQGKSAAPDVWVIDGGAKGQLGIAAQVLAEANLRRIVLFGSARAWSARRAWSRSCSPDRAKTRFVYPPIIPVDAPYPADAGRSAGFAIQLPLSNAPKRAEGSALDDIEGIGPHQTRRAAKAVRQRTRHRQPAADIKRVPGFRMNWLSGFWGVALVGLTNPVAEFSETCHGCRRCMIHLQQYEKLPKNDQASHESEHQTPARIVFRIRGDTLRRSTRRARRDSA